MYYRHNHEEEEEEEELRSEGHQVQGKEVKNFKRLALIHSARRKLTQHDNGLASA